MPRSGGYRLTQVGPGEGYPTPPKDHSYAACLASMLVFLAICVIILIATHPWMAKPPHKSGSDDLSTGAFGGGKYSSMATTSTFKPTTHDDSEDYKDVATEVRSNNQSSNAASTEEATQTTSPLPKIDDEDLPSSRDLKDSSEEKQASSSPTSTEALSSESSSVITSSEATELTTVEKSKSEAAETTTSENDLTSTSNVTESGAETSATATSVSERQGRSASQPPSTASTEEARCSSQQCSAIASRQLSLLNVDAKPCDNFYEYACGALRRTRDLAEADPDARVDEHIRLAMLGNESKSIMPRFFQSFYVDCLRYETKFNHTQRLQKAKEILKSVGSFQDQRAESDALTDLIAKIFHLNSAPLFDILLDVSEAGRDDPFSIKIVPAMPQNTFLHTSLDQNAKKCFLQTRPAQGINVNLEDLYYSHYVPCKDNEMEYFKSLEKTVAEFEAFNEFPEQKAVLLQGTMFAAEELIRSKLISQASLSEADVRVSMLTKGYEKHTVSELQELYSLLNWEDLLRKVVKANSSMINGKTVVQVYMKGYFDALFEQFDTYSGEHSLYNAILAMYAHVLYVDFVLEKGTCDRSKMCLDMSKRLMADTASSLYLSAFDEKKYEFLTEKATEIFEKEVMLLTKRIRESPLIKDQTEKDNLVEKLQNMKLEVGGAKKPTPEIYITEGDFAEDFLQKAIRLLRRRRQRMYSDFRLGRKPSGNSQIWSHFSLATLTKPIVEYGLNAIVIPFGVLTSKYFLNAPEYINMGTLGSMMAHEIIHHFDPTGINYDAIGKRTTAITTLNEYIFQDLTTQLEQQFSFQKSFFLENGGVADFTVKSELSMNERFADVGAMDLAFEVYNEWRVEAQGKNKSDLNLPYINYDHAKSFFIAHAQMFCTRKEFLDHRVELYEAEHLPPQLRVDMIMKNSKYFMKTFACPTKQNKIIPSLDAML
ncbi:phosphate-regulating neutral endopeptidase PHEX-like [Neocloeon triangulifer]|uniref:phosphate-regulating neutral endopeptidase PHEX-like n=1 Tax=Neocloeon triangulifer TaxID=2078957 RepID=UPI00286F507B|nr:phosphate-regulating neutral endopeptidase PHEX-like [Neocloeon triangulifer]